MPCVHMSVCASARGGEDKELSLPPGQGVVRLARPVAAAAMLGGRAASSRGRAGSGGRPRPRCRRPQQQEQGRELPSRRPAVGFWENETFFS